MQELFQNYPLTNYTFDSKNYFAIVDFTRRVKVDEFLSDVSFIYDKYSIKEGEKPEDVSYRFYGTSKLHWVILITNKIIDHEDEWCLPYDQIVKIARKKYTNIFAVHHYVDADGYVVNEPEVEDTVHGPYPVSNLEYEVSENEKKRTVNILRPELVNLFVQEFKKVIQQ